MKHFNFNPYFKKKNFSGKIIKEWFWRYEPVIIESGPYKTQKSANEDLLEYIDSLGDLKEIVFYNYLYKE